jgi:hypothetical protein
MVEYAILLAHNTSFSLMLAGHDVMAWAAGLDWFRIGVVVLTLFTVRAGIWAVSNR